MDNVYDEPGTVSGVLVGLCDSPFIFCAFSGRSDGERAHHTLKKSTVSDALLNSFILLFEWFLKYCFSHYFTYSITFSITYSCCSFVNAGYRGRVMARL